MTAIFSVFHPCGLLIDKSLSRDQLVEAGIGALDESDFSLPEFKDACHLVQIHLHFSANALRTVSVFDANPKFGQTWDEWSEEKEHQRAMSAVRWLESQGIECGHFKWGTVCAGTADKGAFGQALITLAV